MDRHNNFDALRLIAATSVIFSHAFLIGEGQQSSEPLMRLTGGQCVLGVVGVFVFFTISGFLVTQSFEATDTAPRFFAKRALRIYPALFVCLVISAFLLGPIVSTLRIADYLRDVAPYRYLVSNFSMIMPTHTLPGVVFSGYGAGAVIDGPLWTLPSEVSMYLLVGVLGLLRALDLRPMLALIIFGMVGIWFDTASSDYFVGSALWLLPFFAAGMALYRLRDRGIFRGRFALIALAGLTLSVKLHGFILLFPVFGSYLVIYLALERRLPVIKAARFGDLSYGLYIYGWPVEQLLVHVHGGAMRWPELFVLALPLAAALAFLSWHLIEAPALRLKPRTKRMVAHAATV